MGVVAKLGVNVLKRAEAWTLVCVCREPSHRERVAVQTEHSVDSGWVIGGIKDCGRVLSEGADKGECCERVVRPERCDGSFMQTDAASHQATKQRYCSAEALPSVERVCSRVNEWLT